MTPRQRRALVLGGTGFVGRALCTTLTDAGYSVVALGRHPLPRSPARILIADLMSADLPDLLAEVNASVVVNAAGAVWNPTEQQLLESNALVVERVLAALTTLNRRIRLIQLGSSKEYGPMPVGTATTEDAPARPVSTYGTTKLRATQTVLAATRRGDVDGTVLRLPTLIGPSSPRLSLLGQVSAELAAAVNEQRHAVLRLGTLFATQDFLDIDDLARAVVAAAESAPAVGRIINLGYGEAIPVRSLVDMLIAVSDVPTKVIEEDRAHNGDRVSWQKLDISAAAQLLGWTPQRPLRDSLTAVWAAANPR